jgi:quinol monooxygenase YgiN
VSYGYTGTMHTRPGRRDEVVALLTRDVEMLRSVGCRVYAVAVNDDDPDLIWVYEIWDSKGHHDDSLQLPSVKKAIDEALPMLTGEFTGTELTVVGGLGV